MANELEDWAPKVGSTKTVSSIYHCNAICNAICNGGDGRPQCNMLDLPFGPQARLTQTTKDEECGNE